MEFARVLANNSTIHTLDLACVCSACWSVRSADDATLIAFADNNFRAETGKAFAQMLEKNCDIGTLNLAGNVPACVSVYI